MTTVIDLHSASFDALCGLLSEFAGVDPANVSATTVAEAVIALRGEAPFVFLAHPDGRLAGLTRDGERVAMVAPA